MLSLNTNNISEFLKPKITPFFQEILEKYDGNMHSIYLVGSALTPDYIENVSDINSVITLRKMDLGFLDILAPLGKKYHKTGLAAPLVMDLHYIESSLDVFPVEFLNFQLIHRVILGEDLLTGLEIAKADLRRQCERELKSKLIWLRRGYVSAMGDPTTVTANIVRQYTAYIPLFRAIIRLWDQPPPIDIQAVTDRIAQLTGADIQVFEQILAVKKGLLKPSEAELAEIFKKFYQATEHLGDMVDALAA